MQVKKKKTTQNILSRDFFCFVSPPRKTKVNASHMMSTIHTFRHLLACVTLSVTILIS